MTYPFKNIAFNRNRKIIAVANPSADITQMVATAVPGVANNYRGVWDTSGTYTNGEMVLYSNVVWLCSASTTTATPATGSAVWQAIGSYSAFMGAWSSSTAYVVGDEVTYGGNFYFCTTANTNQTPSTSSSYWQVAGPTSLDNVADGTTYTRTLGTVQTGNVPDLSKGILGKILDNIGDSNTYVRGLMQAGNASAVEVPNATFQIGSGTTPPPGWQWEPGYSAGTLSYSTSSPYYGSQYVVLAPNGVGSGNAVALSTVRTYACKPGDVVTCGGVALAGNGAAYIMAEFYTAGGALLGNTGAHTTSPAWSVIQGTATAPAQSSYFKLWCYCYTNALGFGYEFNQVWCSVNDVRVAGSGAQLGDPRNGRALFTAGVQYYLSGLGLSNPSSGAVNCASGTLLMGGSGTGNVAYNASSVTGLTNGTTYYCYYLDPGFTGGSKTLNATATKTNLSNSPDTVYIGYITPQASGGGGGGGGGCVYADAWLDTADGSLVQAKDAKQGLILNAQLDDGTFTQLPILNVPYIVNEPCVQLTTADGSLILSDLTPVNCAKGPFPAFDTAGEIVTVRRAGATATATVTGVPFVGVCPVVRISLGGASFGAGQLPNGYFIYTHNGSKP